MRFSSAVVLALAGTSHALINDDIISLLSVLSTNAAGALNPTAISSLSAFAAAITAPAAQAGIFSELMSAAAAQSDPAFSVLSNYAVETANPIIAGILAQETAIAIQLGALASAASVNPADPSVISRIAAASDVADSNNENSTSTATPSAQPTAPSSSGCGGVITVTATSSLATSSLATSSLATSKSIASSGSGVAHPSSGTVNGTKTSSNSPPIPTFTGGAVNIAMPAMGAVLALALGVVGIF